MHATALKAWAPWLLCAGLAVFAAVGWTARPIERTGGNAPSLASERAGGDTPFTPRPCVSAVPLGLLEICGERLKRLPREGSTCEKPTLATCLAQPEVRRAFERERQPSPSPPPPSAALSAIPLPIVDAANERFNARLMSQVMSVTPAESPALKAYVCAAHALRERASTDMELLLGSSAEPDPDAIATLVESAAGEREAVLADLKRLLGEQRYTRLRSLGGLGVLARSFRCSDDPEATE